MRTSVGVAVTVIAVVGAVVVGLVRNKGRLHSADIAGVTSASASSTRSVSMNLARPFKAGTRALDARRVATIESSANVRRRYATRTLR